MSSFPVTCPDSTTANPTTVTHLHGYKDKSCCELTTTNTTSKNRIVNGTILPPSTSSLRQKINECLEYDQYNDQDDDQDIYKSCIDLTKQFDDEPDQNIVQEVSEPDEEDEDIPAPIQCRENPQSLKFTLINRAPSQSVSNHSDESSDPPPYSPRLSDVFAMSLDHTAPTLGVGSDSGGSAPGVITQVDEAGSYTLSDYINSDIDSMDVSHVILNVRGVKFQLAREDMTNMPESILLGVGLCPGEIRLAEYQENCARDQYTNFVLNTISPNCLQYVLDVFRETNVESGMLEGPAKAHVESEPEPQDESAPLEVHVPFEGSEEVQAAHEAQSQLPHTSVPERPGDVLKRKPAIILLKEDLDYYCLPIGESEGTKTDSEEHREQLRKLKIACGDIVLEQSKVFHGLRNCHVQDSPEYHLLTMLCSSGFKADDTWGYREREPGKTVITSLALVRLSTQNKDESRELSTPHKLLLFWRKPARKCWWDSLELEDVAGIKGKVRVYVRRVWTLELCVLGAKQAA